MAGPVRTRKQWQLQGGPHGTLRRLRNQLAEDGCAESQLVIAKSLLSDADDEEGEAPASVKRQGDKERAAVAWLIKAAEQGNEEATVLLNQCLRSRRGLDENNYKYVLRCLNMSSEEKEARKAARNLFHEVSVDGRSVTTGKLFQTLHRQQAGAEKLETECMETAVRDSSCMKFLSEEGTVYTEEQLLDLASEIAVGSDIKCKMQRELEAEYFSKLSFREKVFKEPGLTFRVSFVQLLEWTAVLGNKILRLLFHPSWHHFVALFLLHWMMSFETLLNALPIFVFYVALFSMVVATVQMLCFRQRLRDLRQWTNLLRLMSTAFSRQRTESLYMWQTFKPYVHFFAATFVFLFSYPLVPRALIPASDLTVLCLALSVTAFVALSEYHDKLILLSIGLQVLLQLLPRSFFSLAPWDYPGDTMPCAGVIVFGSRFRLHVGIPSLFYLIVPIIFLTMAARQNFQGILRVLIPHLVCIIWWQITLLFFADSSLCGLFWSASFFATIVFLIPLVGVALVGFLCFVVKQMTWHVGFVLRASVFFLALWLPSYLSKRLYSNNGGNESKLFCCFRWTSYSFAFVMLLAFYCGLSSHSEEQGPLPFVPWDVYYRFCHKPAWQKSMVIQAELQCLKLTGAAVEWEGVVEMVRVESRVNKMEQVAAVLPSPLRWFFRCWLGTPYTKRHPFLEQIEGAADNCDLSDWSVLTFELVLIMNVKDEVADVFVSADEGFQTFLAHLSRGDRVKVRGTLDSGLGGTRPKLLLSSIQCSCCKNNISSTNKGSTLRLARSLQFVTHFFFSPLVEYRDDRV